MPTLKKKVQPLFSVEDLDLLANDYNEVSTEVKALDEKKKNLSTKIKDISEQIGVKDDKGSFSVETANYIVGKIASKTMKLNKEKAIDFLTKAGLDDCIETIETTVVNEEALEKAVASGKLSIKDVEKFTDVNISYKVSVKAKEVVPEVVQAKLSVAKHK